MRANGQKIIIAWWGSIELGPTIGDQLAVDAVVSWLSQYSCQISVASALPYFHKKAKTVHWSEIDPKNYDTFVFVCGPLVFDYPQFSELIKRFLCCRRIAVGVSILDPKANELKELFDHIVARDGLLPETFDLALAAKRWTSFPRLLPKKKISRVGVILRGEQTEYQAACFHENAQKMIEKTLKILSLEGFYFDTVFKPGYGVREVLKNYDKVDLILTTRMHGTLFAIGKGIPVIAIDQIKSGKKVSAITQKIQWPYLFEAENLTSEQLIEAINKLSTFKSALQLFSSRRLAASLAKKALAISGQAILDLGQT